MKNYNPKDKESIYNYAKGMVGKSFKDICDEDDYFLSDVLKETTPEDYAVQYENKKRKGGLGEIVEERYFHYKADNESRADFPEAKVELKVSPYKINKNKTISAKERLIITMINYMNIVEMDFYSSNVWEKIENILLVYYLWEPEVDDRLDYMINFVYMLSPEGEDLDIIQKDFYKIKEKVKEGRAHELSEGDTLYLGAATKSSTSKNLTRQPFSEIMAKPRAFSLKNSYMTYVLRNYITNGKYREDKILKDGIVNDFEEYILERLNRYVGVKDEDLFEEFFKGEKMDAKDDFNRIALAILGVKTENAEEFEKANIKVKVIRIEENGKIKESMSFPKFEIMDLINQKWEESDIYIEFTETKYLFVLYRKKGENYYLDSSIFWNMPLEDLDTTVKEEWKRAVETFKKGVELKPSKTGKRVNNNLPKLSNTKILHVRPHTSKSFYLIDGVEYGNGKMSSNSDLLPNGDRMTKQSFWLNKTYILSQIKKTN